MNEADQLRAALRQIAEQATQSVDTACGGQILRQIEALARGALLHDPGRRRVFEAAPLMLEALEANERVAVAQRHWWELRQRALAAARGIDP